MICQNPLTVHQQVAGKTCDQSPCQQRHLRNVLRTRHEQELVLRRKSLEFRDAAVWSMGVTEPAHVSLAILPSNDRRVANLPEKRVRGFRDRLMRVISEAVVSDREDNSSDSIEKEEADASQVNILSQACATCRGHCCSQGADHAFINVETIHRYQRMHPRQRPRDILQVYLSCLGKKTYRDSCVYHTAEGCGLPRHMRSQLCNDFFCRGLNQLVSQLGERSNQRVFAVACSEQSTVRGGMIDPQRSLRVVVAKAGDHA